jgi:DNA-binding response OmpR family regulator
MRVLIIEDNKEISDFLKVGLESEGFAVDVISDGEKGSFTARTNEYDLILLDNVLPKKGGLQICKEIREAGKKTPIIMLSVRSEIGDKVNLLANGADDYMTKPFSFEELRARMRAVLRRPTITAHNILTIDDLILDPNRQEVRRGKRDIYLTRKEFSLLEYLLQNRGNVVSRGMIMEHVWNLDGDPFSNTIEAHIFNLRKKIDKPKNKKLIHNVPGRGYKVSVKP